jgi:RNA polymerase sigma-70 factor (sigma-E family)
MGYIYPGRVGRRWRDWGGEGNRACGLFVMSRRRKDMPMPNRLDVADLEQLLAERGEQLMRAAIALTGSRQAGEDLLQAALERVLATPRRAVADTEGYLRRTLYNLAADGWRRRDRWRARVPLLDASASRADDDVAAIDLRDALVRVLLQLPPRQRAVIVLRYWEQLSEAETATLLGCSTGTVKSNASKGMRKLRELVATWNLDEPYLAKEKS